ncbi:MAG: ABC-type uncharacterized transport system permease subunit [Paracoccaceae bacterium]|jgi:ABC-type uncharacterized transport system permease subunit
MPLFCFAVVCVLNRTPIGLNLRAVGENPSAADASGIDVTMIRFAAIIAGGAFIGLAGGYLTARVSEIWVDSVVDGRG